MAVKPAAVAARSERRQIFGERTCLRDSACRLHREFPLQRPRHYYGTVDRPRGAT